MNAPSLTQQESALRRVNEAIERGVWPGEDGAPVRMRCECGRIGCSEFVEISVAEYERVRSSSRLFVLRDGHQTAEVERIVAREARYIVVQKTGRAGRSADRSDPRAARDPDSAG